MIFRFAYPWILWLGFPFLAFCVWWRWNYYKYPTYVFPLTTYLKTRLGLSLKNQLFSHGVFCNQVFLLALLLLVTARPQRGEVNTNVPSKGIAIMLVVDVSESMLLMDDMKSKETRFSIALEQAADFISKRPADEIGLVFFANAAVSRCPLTLDKQLLKKIIHDTKMGVIDPTGTKLSTAIALAAQRLKSSKAVSKIMVVLTDGMPSAYDLDPSLALEYVRKYGIKIYTIGLGGGQAYYKHPVFGLVPCETEYNKTLLQRFARDSGGQFFEAVKASELHKIYALIDQLEKTSYEVPWYETYYELYGYLLLLFLLFFIVEIFMKFKGWVRL
jgi:Ca-activated chloride channel family protein